jgi:hypothetical protein
MLKVKKLKHQKNEFKGFLSFEGQNDYFEKKKHWLSKRGIQGLLISKTRKSQFLSYNASKNFATKNENLQK